MFVVLKSVMLLRMHNGEGPDFENAQGGMRPKTTLFDENMRSAILFWFWVRARWAQLATQA